MTVIDASLMVALFLERDTGHERALRWFAKPRESTIAPAILLPEVAAAVMRQTGDVALVQEVLERLGDASFVELRSVNEALARTSGEMTKSLRLRGCDAIYVALAAMVGEPLATLDREQRTRGAAVAAMDDL